MYLSHPSVNLTIVPTLFQIYLLTIMSYATYNETILENRYK